MEASELLKKVRKIEIKARGLTRQVFAGEYHSAFKGRGISFSEVRGYQYGDDIRSVDWNVTARLNHPYVKVYEEERELTVMLLVDVSGSGNFGTKGTYKREQITEIAALLAFAAINNNDKIGVIFFSDRVEKFISPQKGRKHILRIIRELLDFKPLSTKTSLDEPLRYLTNALKKRCTAFIISDFMAGDFERSLQIASSKHDVVGLRINDNMEKELPDLGMVYFNDPETGDNFWLDTSLRSVREQFKKQRAAEMTRLDDIFTRSGVDNVTIYTGDDYVRPLINLFKKRS